MVQEFSLERIKKYFEQRDDIIAVYLFGSTVKNKEGKASDLDLAVLFKEGMDQFFRFQEKMQIANELETQLKQKIDVVDLRSADYFFIHQVMKNKKLLVDRDTGRRVFFEVDYRKKFFDYKPLYDLYHRQSLKRLKEREC
ncbi:MAG: type VII toxin-antitoxin system MntA family adenylyltransferase antitoxin [Bacillota bacterium]